MAINKTNFNLKKKKEQKSTICFPASLVSLCAHGLCRKAIYKLLVDYQQFRKDYRSPWSIAMDFI